MLRKYLLLVVLTVMLLPCGLHAQELFAERIAFISALKLLGSDTQPFVNEYILRFENQAYKSYAQDEFEKRNLMQNVGKVLQGSVENEVYFVELKSDFGVYDFEKSQFVFEPFAEKSNVAVVNYMFASRSETNTQIELSFINGSEINGLPMAYDKANFLVKMRKNHKSGKVDRTLYLKVFFKLDQNIEVTDENFGRKKIVLLANITSVEAFDHPEVSSSPLSTVVTEFSILEKAKAELSQKAKGEGK